MKNKKALTIALILIVFVAFSRLIPHPPNFTPVIAMGLFGGAYFDKKWLSIIVPLAAMFLADFALQAGFWIGLREYAGFHSALLPVYGCIALIAILGGSFKDKISAASVGGFSIIASILFFVVTNFAVWLVGGIYPTTIAGLTSCFSLAIPFFWNTLISTLLYSAVLFGSFEFYKKTQLTKSVA